MKRALLVLVLASLPAKVLGQGYPAAEAAKRMTVAEGLEAKLYASEPLVRQPVAMEFDDGGRLWVIQYLQYPNPSGLKRVTVDRYSRTAYDRVPEPPPRGPRGGDKITILIDRNQDGRAEDSRDFVDGLNLASGLAFGRGGVFVLQAPYLLFYADRNHDDRPDGDPEVLLSGFGMEDAHSVANSLTWGPDGWLYGLQGSTVTARVRGIEFQQGVWRYHPVSRRFELFCEGGGNMWGLDFDPRGNLFASTNVGGFAMLHGVQGAYYWKSFGKHGPLHNPYTFGYFDHVPHQGLTGGHVSVGGLFYRGWSWPGEWTGRYIVADLLDHSIHWDTVSPRGSTFQAKRGGDVLRSNDTWFAPSDMTLGPDGAVYVADWHDRRTAHPDPDADWDRSNGRIYAIVAQGTGVGARHSLLGMTSQPLMALLNHPNVWVRRKVRRLLAESQLPDRTVNDLLEEIAESRDGSGLEALWSLYGSRGMNDELATRLLAHGDADIRTWGVRLVGDELRVSSRLNSALIALAGTEPSVQVRMQLACTAQRLDPNSGLEIASRLLFRDLDRDDPYIPLLLWWAVEHHALDAIDATTARFATPGAWRSEFTRDAILGRLARRFASEGSAAADDAATGLLGSAPTDADRRWLAGGLEEALRGRRPGTIAAGLARAIIEVADTDPSDAALTRLAARLGSRPAAERVQTIANDRRAPAPARATMIGFLGELGDRSSVSGLLALATGDEPSDVRAAALSALGRFDDATIADRLLALYPTQEKRWQARAREVLLGRASWARAFLAAVDAGKVPAKDVPIEEIARVALLRDDALDALVRKHWGTHRGATPEEKLAEVRRLSNDLRAAPGDPVRGKQLFQERCATCHRLFDEGNTLGPDLTHANRSDREFLLVSLVDPSGVIRKEYQPSVLHTRDGRVLTGLIAEQTPDSITLRDAKNEPTRVLRADVETLAESPTSLMPESLAKELKPDQIRDLFSYLQGTAPVRGKDQK